MSDGMAPTHPGHRRARVAVASDHYLVAESVGAALRSRDFDVVVVSWPGLEDPRRNGSSLRLRRRWVVGPSPDVGVVLSDLTTRGQVLGALLLVNVLDVPWLVLSGAPTGPAWGALYDQGAALVVPPETGLDALCLLLGDLSAGRPSQEHAARRELIRSWRGFARRSGDLRSRLDSLTGREDEVLQQLYEGLAVRTIAERAEVTESTVRSQVKSILRKLDVNSQIAAVAAYQDVLASDVVHLPGWDGDRGAARVDVDVDVDVDDR
jgi:DNA-binding NarL/FixJ family response regulator